MSEDLQKNEAGPHDISLKDLINKLWDYFYYVLSRWKIISLIILVSLAFHVYKALKHNKQYTAKLTFMVNEDESSSLGGLGSLLGSFGGLLGGGGSEYNLDKVLELSKSDKIGRTILLKKIKVNNKEDYLANHLIESFDTLNQWNYTKWYKRPFEDMENKAKTRNYRFSADTLDIKNRLQSKITKQLFSRLFGDDQGNEGIVVGEYGEITGIMKLSSRSYNEDLAIAITNSIYDALKSFYIIKSTEKQQKTFDIMKAKHDSIETLWKNNTYALAKFQDTNNALFRYVDKSKISTLQQSILIYGAALGEAKKNLELSSFALQEQTPFIQAIDTPYAPLGNSKQGWPIVIIMGIALGGFLGVLFVMLQKIYADIMA